MVVDATQINIDNMLVKLHRITQELGSMTYQVKQLRKEYSTKKSHVSGGERPPQPNDLTPQAGHGAGAIPGTLYNLDEGL